MLTLEVIERIEVAIRAKISNLFSIEFGSHWYLNAELFNNKRLHEDMVNKIHSYCTDSSDQFIKRYNSKYDQPNLPPVWMIMETLTLGKLTSLYENLADNHQKKQVAADLGTVVPMLESWLKSINFIRNCCAHHSRLWNRRIPLKPRIPTRKNRKFLTYIDEQTN